MQKSTIPSAICRWILVPPAFFIERFIRDQAFVIAMNSPVLRPPIYAYPFALLFRIWCWLGRLYRRQFDDFSLARYSGYVRRHYSKGGRGYFSYAELCREEKIALFGHPKGRIKGFIDRFPRLVGYRDGESFLDVGCGRGQNIKVLMAMFPNSPIHGVDISEEAVSCVRLAVGDGHVITTIGDFTDLATFKNFGDSSHDHVIMSHVFSVIVGQSIEDTKQVRRMIVEQLIRIAKKSVILIDGPAIMSQEEKFVIEQRDRGTFQEMAADYFPADGGTLVSMRDEDSVACFYTLDAPV
jgi:SAM-dependent methyltransferase